mgnify:CR=1 FL=1
MAPEVRDGPERTPPPARRRVADALRDFPWLQVFLSALVRVLILTGVLLLVSLLLFDR